MKKAFVPGAIIGLVSGLWLFAMNKMGLTFSNDEMSPIEFVSVFIPVIGVFYGVKIYRNKELGGELDFFEGLVHSFKILIVAGGIVIFIGIVYMNYAGPKHADWSDFSGRIFAALVIGILSSICTSLLCMTKGIKIDE